MIYATYIQHLGRAHASSSSPETGATAAFAPLYAGFGFGRGLKPTARGGGDPLSARASAKGTSSSLSSLSALRFFAARFPLAPFPPREDEDLPPRVAFVPVAALAPLLVRRFFAGASLYSSSD